jgi:hypothetical protein
MQTFKKSHIFQYLYFEKKMSLFYVFLGLVLELNPKLRSDPDPGIIIVYTLKLSRRIT